MEKDNKVHLPLDFAPLTFCGEARRGFGEDCWCYGFGENTGLLAVFDGCGGLGARQHEVYANHSEAFMASRLCAGVMYEQLQRSFPWSETGKEAAQQNLLSSLRQRLEANAPPLRPTSLQIKGLRTLPSTMAAALLQMQPDGEVGIHSVWAGDSRVYLLDSTGLSQLTRDDSNQPDPMEGLYDDGTLTNYLSADCPIRINSSSVCIKLPFVVLSATDGCFGYVSTPMEFEGMLLHTLLETNSIAQWEDQLQKLIASYSGDDHTLCLAAFGYGSYEALRKSFEMRYDVLRAEYLNAVWQMPVEDRQSRRKLWSSYRKNYMKYVERKSTNADVGTL